MTQIPFTKVVGTGNDFIVVDARTKTVRTLAGKWAAVSRVWCDRRNGIGADGVLVLQPSRRADVVMRVFNPDGSEAQMCGNGARCVALYQAHSTQHTAHSKNGHITIETKAGILTATVKGGRVAMRMTDPTDLCCEFSVNVDGRGLHMGSVNTGVPHVVIPVADLDAVDVAHLGRHVRLHPRFAPRGTNVNFMQAEARSPDRISVRTYERGVEGETFACGTGVAASAILHAVRTSPQAAGRRVSRRIEVTVRSGDRLRVSMELHATGREIRVANVMLEGPAERVFDGMAPWPHHLPAAAHHRKVSIQ
ncbi:MAG: diaminopimelate epimerase [Candidatus Omnitrophica bacterium]|nr:diaminopimelate epimerase [Candidatus Omnitrophota bacterium]